MIDAVPERAEQRRQLARHILTDLALIERWSAFGRPVLVGAVAYDLVVSPDIYLEIYCRSWGSSSASRTIRVNKSR